LIAIKTEETKSNFFDYRSISSALPQPASPWLFAASYGAPGAIAFAVYWWIAQRL